MNLSQQFHRGLDTSYWDEPPGPAGQIQFNLDDAREPSNVGVIGQPPAHYASKGGMQPFDVIDAFGLDFYEANALKYLLRWRRKNGVEDLQKAKHYIDEVIARADA